MTGSMSLISAEKANEAYSNAVRKARLLRQRAAAERAIAENLDGAYITKRLDPKLHALFPDAKSTFISKYYGGRKYAHIHPAGVHCYSDAWDIDLWEGDDNRVNGEQIKRAAKHSDDEAAEIEKAVERFAEIIGTYNALATAYAGIYDELHVLISDTVYADYSARKRAERGKA